jgi:hypothetical protein
LSPGVRVALPPLPTFLIVGAQKSATRWLRINLGTHPEVFTADAELSYFDHDTRFGFGPDFYRSQFAGWAGEPVVGEATPGYLMATNEPARVAERIDGSLPGVRVLALLRDPVERAGSALLHHVRHERLRPSTELAGYFADTGGGTDDPFGVFAGGRYARCLAPYADRFGDRLLVLLQDDVAAAPQAVYERALAHVGAASGFVPDDLAAVRHSNRSGAPDDDGSLAEARAALAGYYATDLDELEQRFGLDLAAWRA